MSLLSFLYPVGEDAVEDEAEENPIVLEFQQEREAFYIKDPKKALQGFFDREGMYIDFDPVGKNVSTRGCFSRLQVLRNAVFYLSSSLFSSWLCGQLLQVCFGNCKNSVRLFSHLGKRKYFFPIHLILLGRYRTGVVGRRTQFVTIYLFLIPLIFCHS